MWINLILFNSYVVFLVLVYHYLDCFQIFTVINSAKVNIHSFNKYLISTLCVPSPVFGFENMVINKTKFKPSWSCSPVITRIFVYLWQVQYKNFWKQNCWGHEHVLNIAKSLYFNLIEKKSQLILLFLIIVIIY